MNKKCKQCGVGFVISQEERDFVKRVSVFDIPEPTQCPECRMRRRMAFRNERNMYHRKCDFSGRQIISMYKPEAPFPVYAPDVWFGDKWDAKDFGRDFDFSRNFFVQLKELWNDVPQLSLVSSNNENCDFCNIVGNSKNCYLCYGSINCEDCYYGIPFECKDCVDSLLLRNSELCLECVDSSNLYNCYQCQNCHQSRDLKFCYEVRGSNNCIACVGLNRKEYCILNKQYTKEQYEKLLGEMNLCDPAVLRSISDRFEALKLEVPHRSMVGVNNQNVSGNYISNCKSCFDCYYSEKGEDMIYCFQMMDNKDCVDVGNSEFGELCYEIMALYNRVDRCAFSTFLWDGCSNLLYCVQCTQDVKDCFGCVGLKKARYCIFNKQYSESEYRELTSKIVEHMKVTGEWGEFFPIEISPFSYNEAFGFDYYPMSKEEVLSNGWDWYDNHSERMYKGPEYHVPENIDEVEDEVCNKILICEQTGKPFKIIPQELKFYRKMHLPLPKVSPNQRHLNRVAKRNPMKLWDRQCDKCGVGISTCYAPERPERVYCEECYLAEVY